MFSGSWHCGHMISLSSSANVGCRSLAAAGAAATRATSSTTRSLGTVEPQRGEALLEGLVERVTRVDAPGNVPDDPTGAAHEEALRDGVEAVREAHPIAAQEDRVAEVVPLREPG